MRGLASASLQAKPGLRHQARPGFFMLRQNFSPQLFRKCDFSAVFSAESVILSRKNIPKV